MHPSWCSVLVEFELRHNNGEGNGYYSNWFPRDAIYEISVPVGNSLPVTIFSVISATSYIYLSSATILLPNSPTTSSSTSPLPSSQFKADPICFLTAFNKPCFSTKLFPCFLSNPSTFRLYMPSISNGSSFGCSRFYRSVCQRPYPIKNR